MLLIQLVENPPKVGRSPTHMHMNVAERFTNIAALESIPRITLIWGRKALDLCQLVIDFNMAILI
jgi:hypothetical protein